MARLDVETALHARLGGLLHHVFAKGDQATDRPILPTGSTALYSDPIADALGDLGVTPADPFNPADPDLAAIPSGKSRMFLELAEYRLILTALGNFVDVDESAQDRSQDWSALADRMMERAEAIAKKYPRILGDEAAKPRGGASSGAIRHVPPTACPPAWGPGYGRPRRGCGPGPGWRIR